jgi:hypothetical protein
MSLYATRRSLRCSVAGGFCHGARNKRNRTVPITPFSSDMPERGL